MIDNNPKTEVGATKVPLGLVPPSAIIACAISMCHGAEKYGAYNWRKRPVSVMTYVHAIKRHIDAYLDGENLDPEGTGGVHHLGAVMASAAVVLDAGACGMLIDDRPSKGRGAEMLRALAKRERERIVQAKATVTHGVPPTGNSTRRRERCQFFSGSFCYHKNLTGAPEIWPSYCEECSLWQARDVPKGA